MKEEFDLDRQHEYRCGPFVRVPLSSEFEIMYVPATGHAEIYEKRNAQRIASCDRFLRLSQHVSNMQAGLTGPNGSEEIFRLLKRAAESGTLISREDLLRRCNSFAEAADRIPSIQWLVIPTKDRSSGLYRTLHSFIANVQKFERECCVFVSDQTQSSGVRQECREALSALASSTKVDVFYAGEEEKTAFLKALTESGDIPPEVVRFGIFGCSDANANIGANRNATLLQTLGALLLTVDDDTVCSIGCVPGKTSEIAVAGDGDPAETWVFGDRDEARAFLEPSDLDFVGMHERLLGSSPHSVAAQGERAACLNLERLCPHLLQHLYSGTGRILSTYNGLVGDVGSYSVFSSLVQTSNATKHRLTVSPEIYQRALESREVVRQALAHTVSHGPAASGVAVFLGLDNRELLPPFFPPFRSEDGIFGQMLSQCRDGSCIGHIPVALLHDRPQNRTYGDVSTVRMSDLIISALATNPISAGEQSCAERLTHFGVHLRGLGSLPIAEFEQWARTAMFRRASTITSMIETALKRDACFPDFWADDLCERVDALGEIVVDPKYFVPEELRAGRGAIAAKEIVTRFGELLCWWPAIVEKTKELARAGVQIGHKMGN
jgi:hypothetical protein